MNPKVLEIIEEFQEIIENHSPREAAEILTAIFLEAVHQTRMISGTGHYGNPSGYLH